MTDDFLDVFFVGFVSVSIYSSRFKQVLVFECPSIPKIGCIFGAGSCSDYRQIRRFPRLLILLRLYVVFFNRYILVLS